MDPRIKKLQATLAQQGEVQVDFSKAAYMSPKTLRRLTKGAKVWHVSSQDTAPIAASVRKREDFSFGIGVFVDYIFNRFTVAVQQGFPSIVVDEPLVFGREVFMGEFRKKLGEVGFRVKLERESRHRYCLHSNRKGGKRCIYEGDFDNGSGDISGLLLTVSIPPTK